MASIPSLTIRNWKQWHWHVQKVLTSKMMPFSTVWESIPTFNSSKLNLSNLSGVSLLRILQQQNPRHHHICKPPNRKVAMNNYFKLHTHIQLLYGHHTHQSGTSQLRTAGFLMEQVFTACQCDLSCAYFVSFSLSLSYQSKFSVSQFFCFR